MCAVRSHIGLGGNLGPVEATLRAAVEAIAALPGTTLGACSSLYRTRPWGVSTQPDFLNAVVMIETALSPLDLLHALMHIEYLHGRDRNGEFRWGPRMLDLDILLYGEGAFDLPGLRVPHPRLHQRAFALVPLLEIAPESVIPGIGLASDALLALLPIEHPPFPTIPAPDWSARP